MGVGCHPFAIFDGCRYLGRHPFVFRELWVSGMCVGCHPTPGTHPIPVSQPSQKWVLGISCGTTKQKAPRNGGPTMLMRGVEDAGRTVPAPDLQSGGSNTHPSTDPSDPSQIRVSGGCHPLPPVGRVGSFVTHPPVKIRHPPTCTKWVWVAPRVESPDRNIARNQHDAAIPAQPLVHISSRSFIKTCPSCGT